MSVQSQSQVEIPLRPTQRAADKWDSARLKSIFLTSGLYCSQAESRPAHLRLTPAVGQLFQILEGDKV